MNIIQTIAKANYAATETQVETLAHAVVLGKMGESTYLRVLTAHCQAELGPAPRRAVSARAAAMTREAQEAVIDKVHGRLYPHVQKGVQSNGLGGDGELPANEVNRRATFARTSASELRGYVARGGDLRALEVATLTRAQLRNHGRPVPTGTRAERSFQRATEALERAARRVARGDPDAALDRINKAIDALQALAESIEAGEGTEAEQAETVVGVRRATPDRGVARTRVGVPQLHRGA